MVNRKIIVTECGVCPYSEFKSDYPKCLKSIRYPDGASVVVKHKPIPIYGIPDWCPLEKDVIKV